MSEVDWKALRDAAVAVAQDAYAPYSRLHVGAAALTSTGAIITGCNVENASYGLGLCAECGIVSSLHREKAGRLVALCAASGDGEILTPCGRCRQLLYEAGGPDMLVDSEPEPLRLDELLPGAFGPSDLPT